MKKTAIDRSLPVLEMTEWQSAILPGAVLSEADRALAESVGAGERARIAVDELRSGVRVTSRSWVGVARFETFEVRIVPKLAGGETGLVRMIEFASGLRAFDRRPGVRGLRAGGANLFDLIALLFVEACEPVARGGLFADYVEREDDLPVVRGRLLADRQLSRRFGRMDRLACRFEDHEQDVPENRILAAATAACWGRVEDEGVRRRLRPLRALFEGAAPGDPREASALRGSIVYHRMNEHYREAHELAWVVLDGFGVEDVFAPGPVRCFAFFVDMNRLFERFVYRLLARLLAPEDFRVQYQRSNRSILWNEETNQPYARVIPDLLVEPARTGRRLAVEVKYKLYDERKIAPSDVYQNFFYAFAHAGSGEEQPPRALLVYPSSGGSGARLRLSVRAGASGTTAEIHALGLSIPDALDEAEAGERGPATAGLIEAIRETVEGQ